MSDTGAHSEPEVPQGTELLIHPVKEIRERSISSSDGFWRPGCARSEGDDSAVIRPESFTHCVVCLL